jgi:hypothetical protein
LTDPTVIHRFEDNEAAVQAAEAVPHLADILRSYEEAKANIADPAPSWPADEGEAFPGTEKIDVRTVGLPAVPEGTKGTEAMSVAARFLAEQLVREDGHGAGGIQPAPAQGPASPEPRGWWRSVRAALHGSPAAVPPKT